jgi:small-conductance mechanosensitive channel
MPATVEVMDRDDLADACGTDPSRFCDWVLDVTGSPRTAQFAEWFINRPLRIALIVIVAWVINAVARRAIRRLVDRLVRERTTATRSPFGHLDRARADYLRERAERARQRTITMGAVLRSIASFSLFVVVLLLCLGELGIDLAPLIAGAGIAGIAIGLGAQSLVRDFLAGMFIVIEDQYGVGDTVDLGEAKGTVERVTLRTTMVRDLEGTLWVVPNGEIKRVANKSQLWARAVVDLRVPTTADLDEALTLIRTRAAEIVAASPRALEEPEVLGVESFVDGAVVVRVTTKTEPGAQFQVARALRTGLKEILDDDRIRGVPTPPAPPL